MSIVMYRLWCRVFCPVCTVLDLVAQGKRKTKKPLKNKQKEQVAFVQGENTGCT
ncbi:4Fe-4S binding protein [Bacillus massiliigorillae]|uniref:4Fe-4S binding protein n=1 Tax=Bacillus massiliigorillae TaxID=1243664 RepID=UPI0009E0B28C